MRIAIIIQDITKAAGTERAVCNLANQLQKYLGNTVTIISTDSNYGVPYYSLEKEIKLIHWNLRIFNSAKGIAKLNEYEKLKSNLKTFVKSESIDVVIGTYSLFNVLITFLPKKIKKIGCEHFNYASAGKFHKILRRLFYHKLNASVLLTKEDQKNYYFLKNTFVIPNSLSFNPKCKIDYESKIILTIGRLTAQKGYDMLIESAKFLADKYTDWKIKIVGNGEDKEKLDNLIEEYSLKDFIQILPPTKDVISLYNEASIFVCSSRWEGLSMVLLEAQSCGLPCVSFDCPSGPSEIIIDGETGYLVKAGDVFELADKLACLMEDKNIRGNFGHEAFYESKRFSQEAIAGQWKKLLETI